MSQLRKVCFTLPDGKEYAGEALNGLPDGQGSMTFANGDVYEGQWNGGHMEGFGTYRKYDPASDSFGDKYEGGFHQSKMLGMGKMYYSDGSLYYGEWLNGVRSGYGTYVDNGIEIIGLWANDSLIEGTQLQSDGTRYVGQFENNKPSGNGTLLLPDGEVYYGKWVEGELIQGASFVKNGPIRFKGE